jgi:Large polyvalent protein associated domain 22
MGGADELFGTEQTPSVSGADQLFAGEESQAENRLKFVMDETIDETPERAARALEIQKRTGIPKKFIDENFDEIDKTARQADFDPKQYTKSNPKISEWLSRNPDYAPLIREDESVSAIEGMVRVAENTIRSIGAAPSRAGSGLYGVAQAGADVFGADTLSGFFSEQRKSAAAIAESIRGPMIGVGPLERAAYSGIESATQTALMLPAAILSGSPAPLLYTMSAQTGGEAYGQARDKGRDVATSLGYGTSQAVIEYATEMIPASKLLGDLIGNSGFVKTITNQLMAEIPGEQVATILQDLNEWAVLNSEKPFSSYLEDRPSAAAQTLVATIVGTSAQTTVAYGGKKLTDHVDKRSAEKQAKVQEDFFKALGENATNSKLRERLPDSYQDIIGELTKDGPVENVYAPVEFFQSHFQEQGIDPAQLAKELGIERQYQEAVNTGGKIAIPTAIYAKNLAPTEHNAVFAKELSFSSDQMSSREIEEFLKEAEKEKAEEPDQFKESLDQAMTPIREQLKAIYPADIAEKNATVIEARLRARADRLGVDPQELMKQRPISITEDEVGGTGAVLNQNEYVSDQHRLRVERADEEYRLPNIRNAVPPEYVPKQSLQKTVKIYRGVPSTLKDDVIRLGDWVSLDKSYAKEHGSGETGKNKIIEMEVPAEDIVWAGTDMNEWFYAPKKYAALKQSDTTKQKGNEITRGSISVTPTGDIIRLFQSRNLSTLLHEFGHRWLFELQDDAAIENAPQQIKDDLAASLEWLGVKTVDELDITKHTAGTEGHAKAVAANEKWAQGIEAYLKEGKSPSTALRRVFASIRAWLVAVYDALKQGRLDADLSPEIRGVFDRLLATDQEIAAAKSEANMVSPFTTAIDAGMTDIQFAAYRQTIADANREAQEDIDAKIMAEYKRTLTEVWKEDKAKVQAEIEAELDVDPAYAAMAKMQENGIKISRDEAKNLPRNLIAKDGIPADMAAEMLGFTSGEALVKALLSVENRKARVARETDLRMNQRFGDMMTDGTIVEEARKALANDTRAKVIEAEIKALNKKAREVKPFIKAKEKADTEAARAGRDIYKALVPKLANVREHAAAVIAGKPIRELRPMQYYNAARMASRAAVEAVRKSDYLLAGYHKGRELLNLELYREANKAKDEIETGNEKLQKVFVADIKQAKTRNMDMVNAARAILASHGLGKTDESPSSYLEKMRQYDPEIYENLRPIFEPAIASMKNYKDMTVEEYIGMRDAVFALMKTSRRSKQIEIDGKLIERDEAVANLVNRIMDFEKGDQKALRSTLDDLQKTKIGLLSAKASLRRVESWVTAMDGGPDGAFRKFIWNPVIDAVNKYRDEKRKVISKYLEIVQYVAPTIKPGDIEAPELGFKFRGKNELLHALLHTGNESNKAKLLIGYGWGERSEEGVLDTRRWDAFERRMRSEGVLTKVDYDFAQNVWDMMEGMKPALQEAHNRMYGYHFSEVTANGFANEFGTYRGGYVPAKVDVNVVQEAEQRKDAEEIVQGQNSFAFPTSGKGATMKRSEGYARPLQLDMRTIPAHIDWATRFANLEPAVKDVARVILDKDFAKSMNGLDPTTINHMLVPWLQRTAQQLTSTRGMNKWADKFWTGVRARSGMQVMVLNVINTLQQYTGLTIAFTRVKPENLRTALWMYMTKHKEFSEEINEKSSFMRNRVFTSHNEVMQTIDDLLLNPSKYEKAKDFATKHGYFMQQATQGFVDQVVWNAAYNESLSNGKSDKDAVRDADSVVRETQGSFAPEDLSRFEAGTPFVRAFSMFYNYFNMQANLLGTEFANIASNNLGLRKGAGRALYIYTFAFLIPAYVGGALIRALVAGQPDDDDDGYMDDLIRMFFSSQFEALTAMVPVAGALVNTAVNQWNKKWYDDKITTSPAVTAVESAVRAPHSVYKAIVEDGNEKRAVKDTLSLIGMATGLPAGALGRPLGYLADVHQGKANPKGALDVARGLISGQDVNR